MLASQNSNKHSTEKNVQILVDAGADLNVKNFNGKTALMLTCNNNNNYVSAESTVKILIDAGAEINIADKYGYTALILAVQTKCVSSKKNYSESNIIKMLIDAGAQIDHKCHSGLTALNFACNNNNHISTDKTINILLDAGANINNIKYKQNMDIKYLLDNGYSLYHESFKENKLDLLSYMKYIEPRKIDIRIKNALLKVELSNFREQFKFHPTSKFARLTYLTSSWANITEDKLIDIIKKEHIWDFLSISDPEDMYRKISDYLELS
jgi:hypothetical protein